MELRIQGFRRTPHRRARCWPSGPHPSSLLAPKPQKLFPTRIKRSNPTFQRFPTTRLSQRIAHFVVTNNRRERPVFQFKVFLLRCKTTLYRRLDAGMAFALGSSRTTAMQPRSAIERIEILEQKVGDLQELPTRMAAVESRILQVREEMHVEWRCTRTSSRASR